MGVMDVSVPRITWRLVAVWLLSVRRYMNTVSPLRKFGKKPSSPGGMVKVMSLTPPSSFISFMLSSVSMLPQSFFVSNDYLTNVKFLNCYH